MASSQSRQVGRVAGADNVPNVSDAHAFLWSNNAYTDLGSLITSKGKLANYSYQNKELKSLGAPIRNGTSSALQT
jgi:probable HAF family extracellular repeat protein